MRKAQHRIRTKRDLVRLQAWMTEAITTPAGTHPARLAREAARYLTPSETMTARERLEIYINDFWPRCLESLAEDFPGLQKILGEERFETWMEKYLAAYPTPSFTLLELGKNLAAFMRKHYKGRTKGPVLDMIRYEWAQMASFAGGAETPYDPAKLTEAQKARMPKTSLHLQPHIQLIELSYDIPEWITHRKGRTFLKRKTCVITYREHGEIRSDLLDAPMFYLLKAFEAGKTLEKSIDHMMARSDREGRERAEKKLRRWIEKCVQKEWLYTNGNS